MLKAKPDHPAAPLLLADCRLLLGEWKQVIAILDPLLERDPDNRADPLHARDRAHAGPADRARPARPRPHPPAGRLGGGAPRARDREPRGERRHRRREGAAPGPRARPESAHRQRHPRRRARPHGRGRRRGGGAAARDRGEPQPLRLAPASRPPAPPGVEDGRGDGAPAEGPRAAARGPRRALPDRPGRDRRGRPGSPPRATLEALVREEPRFTEAHVSLATAYYRLGRRADGQRHQAIVEQLKREEKAREDAEKARQQGTPTPAP